MTTDSIEQKTSLTMEDLNHLAWATTVQEDDDWYAQAERRIAWLAQATPEQWHSFASAFNWSDDLSPLFWIVRQDRCDMATALMIFWLSAPGWDLMMMAKGEPDYSRPESEMVRYIAGRIAARGYRRRKIAWDADPQMRSDFEEMKANVASILNPPWNPHPDMLRTRGDAEVSESYSAWHERPEDVRTGFWLDLPPANVVTPQMAEAKDLLGSSLFYMFGLGCAVAMISAFANAPKEFFFQIRVLLGLSCWWIWSVRQKIATIRAFVRQEFKTFPATAMRTLMAGCVMLGYASWRLYIWSVSPETRAAMEANSEWVEKGLLVLPLVAIWFAFGRIARVITYRYLFR